MPTACRRADVRFSVTARNNTAIRRAIEAIPDDAWTPISYWIDGGGDVAETAYTCFADDRRHQVEVRLIVRRVRPTPGSQLAMDVVSREMQVSASTGSSGPWGIEY